MNFTSRQIEFINFLLDQLNFNQIDESKKDRFREDYFQQLIKSYHKFKNIANCEYSIILYNDKEKKIPKNAVLSFRYKDNGAFFEIESFSIFNYLQLEIKIKEHGLYDLITLNSDYISASDIANFTYCPVSFAISKSIKSKTLSSAQIGLELHETSIINSMISSESKKEKTVNNSDEISYDENFKNLNDLLKNCEVLYSGHSQSEKIKYFKSLKGNFIGQPDFILRNKITNKIFVLDYYNIRDFHNYEILLVYDDTFLQ